MNSGRSCSKTLSLGSGASGSLLTSLGGFKISIETYCDSTVSTGTMRYRPASCHPMGGA